MEDKYINLSGIAYESLVNGPGIRRVIFAQYCPHGCKGCFNPETHAKDGGKQVLIEEIIEGINGNPILRGVTFSGGEPWEQAEKFAFISQKVQKENFDIWCYTGYTFEFIMDNKDNRKGWGQLLHNIDVLVDGRFQQDLCNPELKYRGSSNQRVIDVKESLRLGIMVLKDL